MPASAKRLVSRWRSARSRAAASSAARSYGVPASAALHAPSCQRPRGAAAAARAKAACSASLQPTCSPMPARPSPVSVTTECGRRSPGYDASGTEALRTRTSSTTSGSAASRSAVARTAEAGEDLAALGQIPVAERTARDDGLRRPRAAAQHLVAAPEVHRRVLRVWERLESRIGSEVARGPLPHVAQHLMAAEVALSLGIGADGRGGEGPL